MITRMRCRETCCRHSTRWLTWWGCPVALTCSPPSCIQTSCSRCLHFYPACYQVSLCLAVNYCCWLLAESSPTDYCYIYGLCQADSEFKLFSTLPWTRVRRWNGLSISTYVLCLRNMRHYVTTGLETVGYGLWTMAKARPKVKAIARVNAKVRPKARF